MAPLLLMRILSNSLPFLEAIWGSKYLRSLLIALFHGPALIPACLEDIRKIEYIISSFMTFNTPYTFRRSIYLWNYGKK